MVNCTFCNSFVKQVDGKLYHCSFCDMDITIDSAECSFEIRGMVEYEDAANSTQALMQYHTFDLLLLLRFCRQERRAVYHQMDLLAKGKHLSSEYAEAHKEAYRQYDYWTKKVRITESLVRGRIAFIPKAVTSQLLDRFYDVFHEESNVSLYA